MENTKKCACLHTACHCELFSELSDYADGLKDEILGEIRLAVANFNYEYSKKMEEIKKLS